MDNNIDVLRKKAGLTVAELAERAGISRIYLQELKSGKKRFNTDILERLAKVLHCAPADILKTPYVVPVRGVVGANSEIFPVDNLPLFPTGLKEHEPPEIFGDVVDAPPDGHYRDVAALRIKGDSWEPVFADGTIVYYAGRCTGNFNEYMGQYVVAMTKSGVAMLKKLRKGYTYGTYTLSSINAKDIEDVELEWCAKVIFIKPE